MKAKNLGKSTLRPESGAIEPGCDGEFTAKEYEFLLRQGRVGPVIVEEVKAEPEILTSKAYEPEPEVKQVKKSTRKRKAAQQPEGFL